MDQGASSDEGELLRRVAQRDREAFAELYDRYAGLLFSVTLRILNDEKEAEAVLQEVFVGIWDQIESFDPNAGKPLLWAVTLARKQAVERRRQLEWRVAAPVESTAARPGLFNEHRDARENVRVIRSAIDELPPDERQAIELAFFGGMTQNEISASLQQPLGTVKARIRGGMLKLRSSLERLL